MQFTFLIFICLITFNYFVVFIPPRNCLGSGTFPFTSASEKSNPPCY